jgi:hypothetical protein
MGDGRRIAGRGWPAVFVATAVLLSLAGCGGDDGKRDGAAAEARKPVPRTIYSLTGEPLNGGSLGQPTCSDAMSRWFDRTDTNHDGTLDLEELLADARRQFAVMDLNHDGMIDPAELTAYRAPFAPPPVQSQQREDKPGLADRVQRSLGLGARRPKEEGVLGGNAAEQPDPVMSADATLRNRVSLDDFLAYERRLFGELDANHDGRISKPELLRLCGVVQGS